MSQSSDSSDQDIPILTDVMVTGHEPHAKAKRPKRSGTHAHEDSHARKHDTSHGAAHEEPPAPSVHDDDDVPVLDAVYESPHDEREHARHREEAAGPAAQDVHDVSHAPVREPAQFVPGEAEFTSGSLAESYVAPPADVTPSRVEQTTASETRSDYDADVLAERLRGRFATYLKGDGRNLIEARCRDAFQDHTTWLVNQITREVALALETEMLSWVREAIREELGNSTTSK